MKRIKNNYSSDYSFRIIFISFIVLIQAEGVSLFPRISSDTSFSLLASFDIKFTYIENNKVLYLIPVSSYQFIFT